MKLLTIFVIPLIYFSAATCQKPESATKQAAATERAWGFLGTDAFRGKAEVARYTGEVLRYGHRRQAELMLITVLEPFKPEQLVKSETETDYYMIKQNQVLSYQTGVYPYRQMNSLFWEASSGRFRKAVMTSQEWCGQTYKELRKHKNTLQYFYSSYWENESRGYTTVQVPQSHALLYDELPLLVRMDRLEDRKTKMFPMLMSSQVRRPDWDIGLPGRAPDFWPASLENRTGTLQWKGQLRNVRIVVVRQSSRNAKDGTVPAREDIFYVDMDSASRPLLRWERNDGGILELQSLDYFDYWQHNDPGEVLPGNQALPK
ncbi:MAG: hypothetical protein KDK23_02140 [Leptospiraceae bacterium]|nr:hypothetical protein [Leptospiraceae bacterium]